MCRTETTARGASRHFMGSFTTLRRICLDVLGAMTTLKFQLAHQTGLYMCGISKREKAKSHRSLEDIMELSTRWPSIRTEI